MADTRRPGAATGPSGGPPGEVRVQVPDHLPFARAASILVVVLAGGLFGYDQGVISGALIGIQKEFAVGAFLSGSGDELGHAGDLFGSLAGGYVADHWGTQTGAPRRRSAVRSRRVDELSPRASLSW